jgi:uncharacterized protein (DUF433 family)
MMPESQYIETRNGGYYAKGSRIPLDVIVHTFRRGESAEEIFCAFPSLGSLARVCGILTFVLEHPAEIEEYLKDQERAFEEFKSRHPMPPELVERLERAMAEAEAKTT